MKITTKSVEIGGKTLSLEVGRFAEQANAAVIARVGDTMVLATVVSSPLRVDLGYFPLTVEYFEKYYAGGKIKGSRWVKREGRASDEAILKGRLIDRSIRPLFPEGYKCEVQVMITVLSVDSQNDPDIPAICATSAAIAISDIPWNGPVGALRVGFAKEGDKSFIANPTSDELHSSKLNLIVSATKDAVLMLEGGASEITEEELVESIDFAHKDTQKIIATIEDLVKEVGKKKQSYEYIKPDAQLVADVEKEAKPLLEQMLSSGASKTEGGAFMDEVKTSIMEKYDEDKRSQIPSIVEKTFKKLIRSNILDEGKRPDGRKPTEIRPIEAEVNILPRTHGSAMFKRGQTQALTVATLGSPSMGLLIENMEGEETKRYMHHYNMPPFSIGETGRTGWPSRREIGHGALAERALEPVIPSEDEFPYTIRVVSEIMSSNGSTSMASVCGSTLSLMDAGVPIKAPVSGIAMGLMTDDKGKAVILTDIMGLEDFNGDMDFKVAGTPAGITAIQMDVKNTKISSDLLAQALAQSKEARAFILGKMLEVMPKSRPQVSALAPKVEVVHIPEEKIGEVIGPGGKMIRKIISDTGANVEVEDGGLVTITGQDQSSVDKASAWVKGLTREVKAGEVFEEATVKRVQPFGAFVEVLPGKEGLVHVSRMAPYRVADPNQIVKVGQKVKVRVTEIDELGRINLSMVFDVPRTPVRPQ